MTQVQEPTLTQRIGLAATRPARSGWGGFVLRRAFSLVLSFAVLVVLTFLIVQLLPGDPALVAAGSEASPEQVERIREQLGLNQPVLVQFWDYVRGVLTGDLGTSFASNEAVGTIILNRLPYTAGIAG
ncbi:ABC transporter permease, partial [Leucobacter sp. M11]